MASAFGINSDSNPNQGGVEQVLVPELIELIEKGFLKARIDSAKGTLVAKKKDSRGEAFRNALNKGEELQKKAIASQLR